MIHNSSVIDKNAKISKDVKIGPFCYIGPNVKLAENVELVSNVHIEGSTSVGPNTKIFPFASIGTQPQDLKFKGEKTTLEIGKNNLIREYVTINPGTAGGGSKTIIGDNCLFMISSHIAHDCIIGNNVIIANNVPLGGHVTIGDCNNWRAICYSPICQRWKACYGIWRIISKERCSTICESST